MKTLLAVSLLFFSLPANGYIWPSSFIVSQVAAKRKAARIVKMTNIVSEMDGDSETSTKVKEVVLVDYVRGLYQSRIYDRSAKELFFQEGRIRDPKAALGPLGTPHSVAPGNFLLLEQNPDSLRTYLLRKNLPIRLEGELLSLPNEEARRKAEVTVIKRWNEKIAWVIGSQKKDVHSPELWVEKGSFLPLRFLWLRYGPEGGTSEMTFDQYKFHKGFQYPQVIQVRENNEAILQSKMTVIDVNMKTTKWPKPSTSGFSEKGRSESSGVQRLITQYYKYVR